MFVQIFERPDKRIIYERRYSKATDWKIAALELQSLKPFQSGALRIEEFAEQKAKKKEDPIGKLKN